MCFAFYLWITKKCAKMAEASSSARDGKEKSYVWRQYSAAFAGSLLALSCGTMLAWTSPVLPLLTKVFGVRPSLTSEQASWVGSLVNIGAFLGALPAGKLADLIGRKRLLLLMAVPMYIAWFILTWTVSASGLYVGRTIAGFTIGVVSVATPVYINEISETKVRGTLGTFFQLQLVLGILLMYIIALFGDVFRMTLACSFFPVLFFGLFIWFPESPTWLLTKGAVEDSARARLWLQGPSSSAPVAEPSLPAPGASQSGLKEFLTDVGARKGAAISLGLMVVQQMSGVNAVVFYTNDIYRISGTSLDPYIASVVTAVVQVLSTLVSTVLIDRTGRRLLLLISTAAMTFCLGSLGFYIYLTQSRGLQLEGLSLLPVICLCLYVTVFNAGAGPVPWIMMGELVPAKHRAIVSAATASLSWGLAFLVTKYFHLMTMALGTGQTFGLFSCCTFLGSIFILSLVPETKGKDADAVAASLGKKKRPNGLV